MRKQILALVVFVVAVVGFGCASPVEQMQDSMIYFKETSTNLCFGGVTVWMGGERQYSITNVPCTPEVLKRIEEQSKPVATPTPKKPIA